MPDSSTKDRPQPSTIAQKARVIEFRPLHDPHAEDELQRLLRRAFELSQPSKT